MTYEYLIKKFSGAAVNFPHKIEVYTWPEPGALKCEALDRHDLERRLKQLFDGILSVLSDLNPRIVVCVGESFSSISIDPPSQALEEDGAIQ